MDFSLNDSVVVFPAFETVNRDIQCVAVTIIDDRVLEGDEQMFEVVIVSEGLLPLGNVEVGDADRTQYIIRDDDDDGRKDIYIVGHSVCPSIHLSVCVPDVCLNSLVCTCIMSACLSRSVSLYYLSLSVKFICLLFACHLSFYIVSLVFFLSVCACLSLSLLLVCLSTYMSLTCMSSLSAQYIQT